MTTIGAIVYNRYSTINKVEESFSIIINASVAIVPDHRVDRGEIFKRYGIEISQHNILGNCNRKIDKLLQLIHKYRIRPTKIDTVWISTCPQHTVCIITCNLIFTAIIHCNPIFEFCKPCIVRKVYGKGNLVV